MVLYESLFNFPDLELLTWVLLHYVHETSLDTTHDELKDTPTILLKERIKTPSAMFAIITNDVAHPSV